MIRSRPRAVLTRRGSKFPVTGPLIEIQMNTKVTDIKSKRRKPRRPSEPDLERMAHGVRLILEGMGEDPQREGLRETPRRVAEMYAELTAGMREDPTEHIVALSGVKKSGAMTVTSAVLGGFRKDPRTRAEAMALITGRG